MVLFGLSGLKENGVEIKKDVRIMKKIKLVPMLFGFVLMAFGIYFSSITHSTFYANGAPTGLFDHPFVSQSFELFLAGTGIQLFELVWYYDSVSSKIINRRKTEPFLDQNIKDPK